MLDSEIASIIKVGAWVSRHHDAIEAVSAASLVFLTVILGWIAFRQFTTTRAQLRAYICLYGGSISLRQLENQTFIQAYVSLKNCGQTPAYNHRSWIRIDLRDPSTPPFDLRGEGQTRDVIGPDGEANLPVAHGPISAQDLADIRNETKRIFVWGRSDYTDAFGKSRYWEFYYWNAKEIPGQGWPLVPSDKLSKAN